MKTAEGTKGSSKLFKNYKNDSGYIACGQRGEKLQFHKK
jgi:hypothetical protein